MVGLAVARSLALRGREVFVLEAEPAVGSQISARNSEVIHAGLYYATDSLKARLSLAGRTALYAYCQSRSIPHRRVGKWVVATGEAQQADLRALQAKAVANGVTGLQYLDGGQVRSQCPELACVAALYSPDTGIVDSHALMQALQAEAESHGAVVVLRSPVAGGRVGNGECVVQLADGTAFGCRSLINSAGLSATQLARALAGLPARWVPPLYYAKGRYFAFSGRCPFSQLVYPLPQSGGLGVHLTLNLAGQARFGPDVQWVDAPDYGVDAGCQTAFEQAIRAYWPGLPSDALRPDFAGIRPKLAGPGEPAADFRIDGPAQHGVPGLVNLFGIESPGLTASLAIGEYVADLLA